MLEYLRVMWRYRRMTFVHVYHLTDGRKITDYQNSMCDDPGDWGDWAYFEAEQDLSELFCQNGYPNPERHRGVLLPDGQAVPIPHIVSIEPRVKVRRLWTRQDRKSAWHNYQVDKRREAETKGLTAAYNASPDA